MAQVEILGRPKGFKEFRLSDLGYFLHRGLWDVRLRVKDSGLRDL